METKRSPVQARIPSHVTKIQTETLVTLRNLFLIVK